MEDFNFKATLPFKLCCVMCVLISCKLHDIKGNYSDSGERGCAVAGRHQSGAQRCWGALKAFNLKTISCSETPAGAWLDWWWSGLRVSDCKIEIAVMVGSQLSWTPGKEVLNVHLHKKCGFEQKMWICTKKCWFAWKLHLLWCCH